MSFRQKQSGDHMEYLVASMFQGEGYFVRRGALLYSSVEPTDIDVLGIKLSRPFQLHRIICDCKDKARSKPYERIFWVKGLGSFVNAAEVYIALPQAKREIIEFAKSGQVRVLTQEVTEESCTRLYNNSGGHAFGLANESFYSAFFARLEKEFRKDKDADTYWGRSQSLFLAGDPYVALNNVFQDLRTCLVKVQNAPANSEEFEIWRFIIGNYVALTSYLILAICADTVSLTKESRVQVITDRLSYGNLDPEKVQQLLDLMNRLALELARAALPGKNRKEVSTQSITGLPAPSYAKDLIGLVDRALSNPEIYMELPRYLDYFIFELTVQNRELEETHWHEAFGTLELLPREKVARNILAFLSTHLKADFLRLLFPRNVSAKLTSLPAMEEQSSLNINRIGSTELTDGENKNSTANFSEASNERKRYLIRAALASSIVLVHEGDKEQYEKAIEELIRDGWLEKDKEHLRLTEQGQEYAHMLELPG